MVGQDKVLVLARVKGRCIFSRFRLRILQPWTRGGAEEFTEIEEDESQPDFYPSSKTNLPNSCLYQAGCRQRGRKTKMIKRILFLTLLLAAVLITPVLAADSDVTININGLDNASNSLKSMFFITCSRWCPQYSL